MYIVVCDDDPIFLSSMEVRIRNFFTHRSLKCPTVSLFQNGDELLKSGITPDIAFLDVEMPGRSGIHVGTELMQKNVYVKIIIITSFPDYLDEAMDFHVYRYLSKPIDENRFCRSLSAALKQLHMETVYIHVRTVDGGLKLRADEIICVERRKNKVMISTTTGQIITATNFEEFSEQLLSLPTFFQTHRSYIVNLKYVSHYKKDAVLLTDKSITAEAYLTRRKFTEFQRAYALYLGSSM